MGNKPRSSYPVQMWRQRQRWSPHLHHPKRMRRLEFHQAPTLLPEGKNWFLRLKSQLFHLPPKKCCSSFSLAFWLIKEPDGLTLNIMQGDSLKDLLLQSVVCTPAASWVSPRSLLETQHLRLHSNPPSQNLHFNKTWSWFLCILNCQKHQPRKQSEKGQMQPCCWGERVH